MSGWDALKAWVSARRQRRGRRVEVISEPDWMTGAAALPPPGRTRSDPWAAAEQSLNRRAQEFEAIEALLTKAAQRDGLDDDGPMTLTFQALRLCIASLREMTRITAQIPGHYVGQIQDAIAAARQGAQAETARFRAELQHTEADIIQRIAKDIARSADKALTQEAVSLQWWSIAAIAFFVAVTAVTGGGVGLYWGRSQATAEFTETETRLHAAFARGPDVAAIWANIMEWNPRLPDGLPACIKADLFIDDGQRACRMPMWVEPRTAPPRPPVDNPDLSKLFQPQPPPPPPPPATTTAPASPPPPARRPGPPGPVHFGE
jgi:hypothetical protein